MHPAWLRSETSEYPDILAFSSLARRVPQHLKWPTYSLTNPKVYITHMFTLRNKKKIITFKDKMTSQMVGGKFEKQKQMHRAGFLVPPFFCLTSAYYEEIFDPVKKSVTEKIDMIDFDDRRSIKNGSKEIKNIFKSICFTGSQKQQILKYFDSIFANNDLVSVRASMIGHNPEESEDSMTNPFAGISDSFLYVTREQIFDKIRQCWASGFNEEGLLYRRTEGMDYLGFTVAVGVQEMIFGQRSFLIFTCTPETASKDMVIVAGYGIGEGIVQEKVSVDHFFINSNNYKIRASISNKKSMLTFHGEKGYGLIKKNVPEHKQQEQALTDEEIRKLVLLGKKIENIFKHPQDIEGTLTKNGQIYFTQSRPVSLDYSDLLVWSNANITESFPGVTTVLTYSIAKFFYRVVFYDSYIRAGYHPEILHKNYEILEKMVGFLKGRVYYRLSSFYYFLSLDPLFPFFRKPWENIMGLSSSYQTKPAENINKFFYNFFFLIKLIKKVTLISYLYVTHQKKIKKFNTWWNKVMEPHRGKKLPPVANVALVNTFYKLWNEVGVNWGVTLTNDTFLPVFYNIAESFFKKWNLQDDPSLLTDLLCGDDNLISVEIILSAVRMAEFVRSDRKLRQIFTDNTPHHLWSLIENSEISQPFCEKFKTHLYKFGERGLQELKMEQPSIKDEPWLLLKTIQGYVKTEISVEGFKQKEIRIRENAEKRLKEKLTRHPLRLIFLKWLLHKTRCFIRNRENARYFRSELFGFSKNLFMTMGKAFEKEGTLKLKKDIVHLTMDEIFGYIDGSGVTESLQQLVEIRGREYIENKKVETPLQITTMGQVRKNSLELVDKIEKSNVLQGIGSSAGRVRGLARVVINPSESFEINQDMILVAKETDPGWLFLMLAAKGMVVERGNMLSHTAITGRKFGIPTIVDLPNATKIIPDGAEIEIDGSSGLVKLLDQK